MNERIQELAKQIYSTEATDQEIEFAELIVRECIDIAYREGDNVAYLALHFGVEE